ncbi:hypothetical protein PIB30_064722 [Stylosanthes scabra]|uniref:Uncharacterized protein n=1 Tax=Stylosanthes scabra TaxID=79078 RepID=A0ABU6VLZ9_9FABA|nr:hypothetical protein [Stylosanthes scabra]
MDEGAGPSHAQHAEPLVHEPSACYVPGPRSQSSQYTVNLAHDGVAPQPGTMTQWLVAGMMTSYPQLGGVSHVQLFSGMHDTPPVASSHVFTGPQTFNQTHGTPPVASPHAFVGSHTFDQLHSTSPGSHVTGSSSGGSGSHGSSMIQISRDVGAEKGDLHLAALVDVLSHLNLDAEDDIDSMFLATYVYPF